MEDFTGAKVAGQINTLYADLVPQLVAKGAVKGEDLKTVPQLVQNLKAGVIDGTILEEPVAIGLCAANSELSYVKFAQGFDVAEEDVLVSIGVRKGYEHTAKINEILASISEQTRTEIMGEAVEKN
jgi:putative lysine transport system substrate-binding protein/putative lysine transport system permease protein